MNKFNINSKVSSSTLINIFGFQSLKYLLSKSIKFLQLKIGNYNINNKYSKNGYLFINNFLNTNEFKRLGDEFNKLMNEDFIIDSFDNIKNKNSKTQIISQDSETLYQVVHGFHIFEKNHFFSKETYWNNEKNDPFLYVINEIEALDVDSEDDFLISESVYKKLNNC